MMRRSYRLPLISLILNRRSCGMSGRLWLAKCPQSRACKMLSRNSNRLLPAIDMSKATTVGARAEHKVRRPAPRRQFNKVREGWTAFAFLAPSLIGFGLFVFGPILAVFLISFFDWSLLSDPEFIGMENYSQLASDARVGSVYKTTLLIAALSVVLNIVLGLAIALLLESQLSR